MVTRGAGTSLGPEVARHSPSDRFMMALDFYVYGNFHCFTSKPSRRTWCLDCDHREDTVAARHDVSRNRHHARRRARRGKEGRLNFINADSASVPLPFR